MVSVEQPNKIKSIVIFLKKQNDQIDAFISLTIFIQRQVNSIIKEEEYLALQHLTRTRYQLIKQLVRTKQHFIENIYYKCNTLSKELKSEGGSVLSATLVTLMTEDYNGPTCRTVIRRVCDLIQKLGVSF